jgi:hypothetical protein
MPSPNMNVTNKRTARIVLTIIQDHIRMVLSGSFAFVSPTTAAAGIAYSGSMAGG